MISTASLHILYDFVYDEVEERETRLRNDRNHPDACRHCVENEEALIRDLWTAVSEVERELKDRGELFDPVLVSSRMGLEMQ